MKNVMKNIFKNTCVFMLIIVSLAMLIMYSFYSYDKYMVKHHLMSEPVFAIQAEEVSTSPEDGYTYEYRGIGYIVQYGKNWEPGGVSSPAVCRILVGGKQVFWSLFA